MALKLYTDGSGTTSGHIGWAFIVVNPEDDSVIEVGHGSEDEGTNNIAEMLAIINGLEWLKENNHSAPIEVFSDSAYVVNAFREDWFSKWEKRNWRNTRGRPVKNKEYWQRLQKIVDGLNVSWYHIPSHAGIKYNEACDSFAKAARHSAIQGIPIS